MRDLRALSSALPLAQLSQFIIVVGDVFDRCAA
jgi:hypothetical protein